MKHCSITLTAIALILLLTGTTGCVSQPDGPSESVEQDSARVKIYSRSEELPPVEIETKAGEVVFSTVPAESEVLLNGRAIGKSPLRIPLSDGSYNIRIQKERYHPADFFLDIQEDTVAAVRVELQPFTGMINPRIQPADAEVQLGGIRAAEFPVELPVGTYTLQVQRFGFKSASRSVEIKREETARPQVILEPAPFVLEKLTVQPKRLRHSPPLPPPRVQLSGTVSAPGTVDIEIRDAEGNLAGSTQFSLLTEADFTTSFELTEGSYTVTIRARGEQQGETILLEKQLEVHTENRIALFTTGTPAAALPIGLPRAGCLPSGMLQSGFVFGGGGMRTSSPAHFPAQLSLAAGLPAAFELQGTAGFFIHREENPFWAGSVQVKKELFSIGAAVEFAGALQLLGSLTTDSESKESIYLTGSASGAGAGPIFELSYSPQADILLGIGVSPTVQWEYAAETGAHWNGRLRSGIFVQSGKWASALAAKTTTEFSRLWYGLELSRLMSGTSMFISISAGGVAEDNLIDYYTGGIGFYYIR